MKPLKAPKRGFTMIEVAIAIVVIGVVAAVALPSLVGARDRGRRQACIQNMVLITETKEQWAIENRKRPGQGVSILQLRTYFRNSAMPTCPAGGTYTIGRVGAQPTCSRGATLGHTL
jgi:prepilin-type N-terminal cleavage/methylation domain-containing protein